MKLPPNTHKNKAFNDTGTMSRLQAMLSEKDGVIGENETLIAEQSDIIEKKSDVIDTLLQISTPDVANVMTRSLVMGESEGIGDNTNPEILITLDIVETDSGLDMTAR